MCDRESRVYSGTEYRGSSQQQNPEPQVRNETDEDESVDSSDYFALPQSQDIHAYFFFLIILNKPLILPYQKFFKSKDGTNCKWLT